MDITFYNTLTRKREKFVPLKKGEVGMYCCGPTVYWYQHIGNLRAYIFEDILKRVLLFNNLKVKHVINVTDVGHLTSDADEGEDKLVKAIKREGLPLTKESMLKLADKYFLEFKTDLNKVKVLPPDHWTKATTHVKEMIELIKKIEKNGFTYLTSVGLIYDTSKFKDYVKLGRLNLEELEHGARTKKDSERKNISDFALWVTNQQNHLMLWDSPWGKGFPGWHIECSAMSMKYLGEQFDIHCGGKEHIQVHHTNEIAQSEAATGKKPWVKYWLHNEWLTLQRGKMSKSKGSFIRLADLIEKNYDPLDFRYFCLGTHYRKPLVFSYLALDGARNARKKLVEQVLSLNHNSSGTVSKKYYNAFSTEINNDLNTSKALAVVWEMLKDNNLIAQDKYATILKFDEVLGLNLNELKKDKIPTEILKLAKERLKAREEKDWKKSDLLREEISKLGYIIGDTKDGFEISKA